MIAGTEPWPCNPAQWGLGSGDHRDALAGQRGPSLDRPAGPVGSSLRPLRAGRDAG